MEKSKRKTPGTSRIGKQRTTVNWMRMHTKGNVKVQVNKHYAVYLLNRIIDGSQTKDHICKNLGKNKLSEVLKKVEVLAF